VQRPALEVADIFRDHGPAWRQHERGHLSLAQLNAYFAQGRPSIHGKPVHGFAPCRSTAREAGRGGLSIKDDHSSMIGFSMLNKITIRL